MKKYPMLVAEIPFSKGIGGHCTLISENPNGEDGRITNILGIARGQDQYKGDTFLSVARDSIQTSSGRSVRDVVLLMNFETARSRPELLDDYLARLRCFLDQFKELQAEMDQQAVGPARTIVVSNVLRSWLSTMEGLEVSPTTSDRSAPVHRNDATPSKYRKAWLVLAVTAIAGIVGSIFLWDFIQSPEPNRQTIGPNKDQPDPPSLPPSGLPQRGENKFKKLIGRIQEIKGELSDGAQIDTQVSYFVKLILSERTHLNKAEYDEAKKEFVFFLRTAIRIRSVQFQREFRRAIQKKAGINQLSELKRRYLEDLAINIIPPVPLDYKFPAEIHKVFECDLEAGKHFYSELCVELYTDAAGVYYSGLIESLLTELAEPDLERVPLINGRLFSVGEWATLLGTEKKPNPEDALLLKTGLSKLLPRVAAMLESPISLHLKLEIAQDAAKKAFNLDFNQFTFSPYHSVVAQSNESKLDIGDPTPVAQFFLDKKSKIYFSTVSLLPKTGNYLKIKEISWRLKRPDAFIRVEFIIADCCRIQDTKERMVVIAMGEQKKDDAIIVSSQLLADQDGLRSVTNLKAELGKVLVELGGKR